MGPSASEPCSLLVYCTGGEEDNGDPGTPELPGHSGSRPVQACLSGLRSQRERSWVYSFLYFSNFRLEMYFIIRENKNNEHYLQQTPGPERLTPSHAVGEP